MSHRNKLALLLILVSLALLIPGLFQPLITIHAQLDLFGFHKEIFRETRSIWQTITGLFESNDNLVAFLILLFSILVPFLKAILLLTVLLMKNHHKKTRIYAFVHSISKWSMADVFVVGVFMAFLSAKAMDSLGGELHNGFYFFTAYCLVSLLSVQVMSITPP